MRSVRELVEEGHSYNTVGLKDLCEISGKRLGVARNVNNETIIFGQRKGVCVQAASRRVDEQSRKVVTDLGS